MEASCISLVSPGCPASRTKEKVLVIDHEPGIRRLLDLDLSCAGFGVATAAGLNEALIVALEERPVIAVAELVTLGGLEGLTTFMRRAGVPVVVLSIIDDELTRLQAFAGGADDYLLKPFCPEELVARVRAVLRRLRHPRPGRVVRAGGLEIDLDRRTVRRQGALVPLSRVEWRLLFYMAENAGRTLPGRQILTNVWGGDYAEDGAYLRVWVHRLRTLVEEDPSRPEVIVTAHRTGYRLQASPPRSEGPLVA